MTDCRVMSKVGMHLSQPEYTSGLVQVTLSQLLIEYIHS